MKKILFLILFLISLSAQAQLSVKDFEAVKNKYGLKKDSAFMGAQVVDCVRKGLFMGKEVEYSERWVKYNNKVFYSALPLMMAEDAAYLYKISPILMLPNNIPAVLTFNVDETVKECNLLVRIRITYLDTIGDRVLVELNERICDKSLKFTISADEHHEWKSGKHAYAIENIQYSYNTAVLKIDFLEISHPDETGKVVTKNISVSYVFILTDNGPVVMRK